MEKLKCTLLSERQQSKESYTLYESDYMTFWKRKNYGDRKKRKTQWLPGKERVIRQSTQDF